MGVLSVTERNSTSPHYIANGERDIHFFILNAKGTDTRDLTKKNRDLFLRTCGENFRERLKLFLLHSSYYIKLATFALIIYIGRCDDDEMLTFFIQILFYHALSSEYIYLIKFIF